MNAIEQQIAAVLPDVFADGPTGFQPRQGNEPIPEGQRNDVLMRMAGAMRRRGFDSDAIEAALKVTNERRCSPALTDAELGQIARSVARYAPRFASAATPAREAPPLVGLTLDELSTHTFPERKALLMRGDSAMFCSGYLGEVYAERGRGKTWFLQTLALVAGSGCSALGFHAPEPCRVLYIDGEMAATEIQERFALLRERLQVGTGSDVTIVAADWQTDYMPRIDTAEGQAVLEPFVEAADLIIIDNRSCLTDPESEKDPSAWQPTQDWLLSLRRGGKAVLLAHHSNRMGGARGHSRPEDVMNTLIKLSTPDDYSAEQGARFVVTFDKSRGAYGSAVAPFQAHLTPEGWIVQGVEGMKQETTLDRLLDYLRAAHEAGDRPKSANTAVGRARLNRAEGLRAWATLLKAKTLVQHPGGGFYVP